ncbi:MAG TPA: two-component regulator propeller domain-containing protein [Bryobacteraceae bacterium]|nr:two-component regulator propeller domain-containing protein [Bryobacteraceae bacterium]
MRFAALLVFSAALVWAVDPNRALTQYSHRIWQTQQGLPEGAIRALHQSGDGYLWLGMDHGLFRFDGVRFSTPGELLSTALANASVRQIVEDAQQNIWVATNGAGLFRWRGADLVQFSTQNGLPSNAVFCAVPDRSGSVWACTSQGMARIVGEQVQTFRPGMSFAAAALSRDGTLWAGGQGNQLTFWNGEGDPHHTAWQTTVRTLPPLANIQALLCATDGTLWIGSTEGLVRIANGKETRFTKDDGLASDTVFSLDEASDGTLWIGTNDGFSRFRNGEIQSFGARDGLSQSTVFSVYQDHEGSLWAGTKRGLNQFIDRRAIPFTTSEGLPSNDTGPVLQDRAGILWVGSAGMGLARFDGKRWSVFGKAEGLSSDDVAALAQGPSGELWAGGESGLDLLVNGAVKQTWRRANGLPSDSVRSLFVDRQGALWIGTDRGAAVLRNGRIQKLAGTAAKSSPVLAFAEDDGGRIYAGSEDFGVSSYEERSLSELPEGRYPIANVDAMYFAGGTLWVGTDGGGLVVIENGRALTLTEENGLYDNNVYGIVPDGQGRLWMACSRGIFSVSREDLEKFRAGGLKEVSSSTYSPMDGLQALECRPRVQPAAWRLRDGHLCFSMIRGLIVLDPFQMNAKTPPPQVSIENVTVDGRRMPSAALGEMTPGSKNIAFTYTGLSFRSPRRITFRYILEGFDKHWTEANTRRQAFYTNLPPGRYRFRVTACNYDGSCNEAGAAVAFRIPAPFYQRTWFLAASALLVLLAAVFAYRTRIEGMNRQFAAILGERSRIARELHDTLIQGFSGVTMQMQALAGRLAPHERSVLDEIIHDAAHCLTEARRSVAGLRGVQHAETGLAGEIEQLARQAADSSGLRLKLHLDRLPSELPAGLEYNLVRIAQEAVLNAVKHSRAQFLKLSLRCRRGSIGLAVADDGTGFDPAAHGAPGHYGLIGMRERARDIGAEFAIESAPGRGTTVRVAVPLPRPAARAVKTMGD